jgi:hypothetical protein
VSGALSDSEILIVEGIQGLRDGQALNIQNPSDIGLSEASAKKTKRTQEAAG